MKIRNWVLASALLATALSTSAQKQWTLKECIDYAMQNNIKLQQSKITNEQNKENVLQAKAELMPSLSASTSHQFGYQPWPEEGRGTVANGYVETSVDKTSYTGSYGLNANWTVWNGGKNTNNVKLQQLTQQQSELAAQQTANSIQEQIAQLYVQILYEAEAVKVDKEALGISNHNVERGNDMVKVGSMSKADLAQLKAQAAQDEYSVVNAQTQLANYKLQLKQLLELTGTENFDVAIPTTTDEQALAEIPTVTAVYDMALSTRPEIQSSKLGIESSDIDMKIAKAGKSPTVSFSGSLGSSTNSYSSNGWGQQMKNNFNTGVGVNVSVPLFDNRSTKTAVNKAKLSRQSQELELQNQQKELYSTIENYWLQATSNQQRFKAAQTSVESTQESYDLLNEQFRLGLKNIVELTTGKTNLLNAQQSRLESKYTTILNQQMLKFYKGEGISM